MFHGLSIPYIGETELSVKKPCTRTVKTSLEQLSKKQLELMCRSYTNESFSKKEEQVEYLCSAILSTCRHFFYYENYIDYLHKHNANKDIIELEAIKDIMMDIIKRADQVNLANGRTPFSYSDVREDGTFDIKGRTSGFTANEIYKISYTDDISGETYIKIDKTIEDPMSLEEPETKTIYVNKDGEIVNTKNKETIK